MTGRPSDARREALRKVFYESAIGHDYGLGIMVCDALAVLALDAADAVSEPTPPPTQNDSHILRALIERHANLRAQADAAESKSRAHHLRERAKGVGEAIALLTAAAPEPLTPRPPSENLIVEFVVPHYFASLFASQYPDEYGGFGAQVFFRDTHSHPVSAIGDVTFIENAAGRWLIDIEYEADCYPRSLRTFIEEVERIVVL